MRFPRKLDNSDRISRLPCLNLQLSFTVDGICEVLINAKPPPCDCWNSPDILFRRLIELLVFIEFFVSGQSAVHLRWLFAEARLQWFAAL